MTICPVLGGPTTSVRPVDPDVLRRVRAEYDEMPGLLLTEKQAARLWGCDVVSCQAVLEELESRGFLIRARSGGFVRASRRTGG